MIKFVIIAIELENIEAVLIDIVILIICVYNRFVPAVFHNLKGYYGHFIISEANVIIDELGSSTKLDAVPLSYEKLMSCTVGNLRFIDSFQFLASSLDTLVENLYDDEDKYKHFHHMKILFR